MGATMSAQVRLGAVIVAAERFLTGPDIGFRSPVTGRPVCVVVIDVAFEPLRGLRGETLQTAVIFVVTRRYSSGLLNFARIRQKMVNATENAVLRALSGPYRRDRSSTDRRLLARRLSAPPLPAVTAAGVPPLPDRAAMVSMAETLIGGAGNRSSPGATSGTCGG
jgi:hypothetical protein